jgi:predicted phosphodiesterase
MKIQVMSDLHLEMHADGGAELIRELDRTGVDVLVLAGDITMARYYESLASVHVGSGAGTARGFDRH